jgi:hypothetical protein
MVSRKHPKLTIRDGFCLAAFAVTAALAQQGFATDPGRKFYADDPMWREPAPRPVGSIASRSVEHIYDFLESAYVTPRREGKIRKRSPQPALDTNTLGELPDSSWYTNRHAFHRMSIADLQRGPGNSAPPDPDGTWRITSAKSNGITPGFVIEDGRKNRYLLKLDPPLYPEMCSAADVIGSKFFYALGYNTPENYVVHFRRKQLEIGEGVMYRDPSGKKTPLTEHVVDKLLRAQSRLADGTYRALASRWLEGKVIGPFDYRGTRSDDPNDTIPHEHRRVLRGLAVFAAWLNHHDTSGHKEPAVEFVTLGLRVPNWQRSHYPKLKGVGLLDEWSFEPLEWKPEVANPAFLLMDKADAFWAAKQVAAFTDDEIRAIVETGKLSDERAADWIVNCLIKRRDKIAQAWFSKVLALDRFRVVDGTLVFDDLSASYETRTPKSYDVQWSTYDNDLGVLKPLSTATGPKLPPAPNATEYLAATIRCAANAAESCLDPVTVYLRRSGTGFELVGIDR